MASRGDIHILDIVVLGKDEAALASHQEVDLVNVVSFEENVLLFQIQERSQKVAQISDEAV